MKFTVQKKKLKHPSSYDDFLWGSIFLYVCITWSSLIALN